MIRSFLKFPRIIIEYFGLEVIIGAGLCWALGGGVFLVIILACSPSF
ncbi:MAG: hypothetical protein VX646_09745 [Verrucomicrobiota bacterium]|nr:hypothetical protein [Verrucomicrobiota bacterium]